MRQKECADRVEEAVRSNCRAPCAEAQLGQLSEVSVLSSVLLQLLEGVVGTALCHRHGHLAKSHVGWCSKSAHAQ